MPFVHLDLVEERLFALDQELLDRQFALRVLRIQRPQLGNEFCCYTTVLIRELNHSEETSVKVLNALEKPIPYRLDSLIQRRILLLIHNRRDRLHRRQPRSRRILTIRSRTQRRSPLFQERVRGVLVLMSKLPVRPFQEAIVLLLGSHRVAIVRVHSDIGSDRIPVRKRRRQERLLNGKIFLAGIPTA